MDLVEASVIGGVVASVFVVVFFVVWFWSKSLKKTKFRAVLLSRFEGSYVQISRKKLKSDVKDLQLSKEKSVSPDFTDVAFRRDNEAQLFFDVKSGAQLGFIPRVPVVSPEQDENEKSDALVRRLLVGVNPLSLASLMFLLIGAVAGVLAGVIIGQFVRFPVGG